ncbi:hypothetical protein B7L70_09995 [Vulcanisaeta sp. EB80]|uniref:hypothetical protein n=1 Tax=Vulcanisaeta sp. EB80 TaxID=1650660 RepID=UPI0009BE754C|nr:hypothetical protein [Vulcanisaeta sp. EB80]PLC65872.1 hypothetical protein B7L70_09995 [Vulcanisaeta sp. EB80]
MLCRAVAVELEVTRELSKLLYSVESAYLNIVREVVEYAVVNNVTGATQLQGLFYSRYRLEYRDLNSHLIIQAIASSANCEVIHGEEEEGLGEQALPRD